MRGLAKGDDGDGSRPGCWPGQRSPPSWQVSVTPRWAETADGWPTRLLLPPYARSSSRTQAASSSNGGTSSSWGSLRRGARRSSRPFRHPPGLVAALASPLTVDGRVGHRRPLPRHRQPRGRLPARCRPPFSLGAPLPHLPGGALRVLRTASTQSRAGHRSPSSTWRSAYAARRSRPDDHRAPSRRDRQCVTPSVDGRIVGRARFEDGRRPMSWSRAGRPTVDNLGPVDYIVVFARWSGRLRRPARRHATDAQRASPLRRPARRAPIRTTSASRSPSPRSPPPTHVRSSPSRTDGPPRSPPERRRSCGLPTPAELP